MIKENIIQYQTRNNIPKYIKEYKENNESNVVSTKRTKLYEYYKCDYCKDEIKLNKKRYERSGGIVIFPHSLTKCGKLELVLCNKCLNKAINEFKKG